MHNLGTLYYYYDSPLKIHVAKTPHDTLFDLPSFGYTAFGGMVTIATKLIDPDLVILFGCCGSLNKEMLPIGATILCDSSFHMDRFRTKDQDSFEWGFWAGQSLKTPNLIRELELAHGHVGTTVGKILFQNSYDQF